MFCKYHLATVGMLYYLLIGQNNLIAKTAEEEFALLDKAQSELEAA
ncbi:TPA: hypothetical protein ACN99F_002407 [Vibrio metschnikovii]